MPTLRPAACRLSLALMLAVAGAAVHAEGRYAVSADGQEVTDATSHLTWRRCAEGMTWDGKTCSGKLVRYDFGAAKKVAAGASGWRVPSREELLSLVQKGKKKPWIDAEAFPKTPNTSFWATRAGSDDNLNAWLVNFGNGKVMGNLGEKKFPLRLVKSSS